VTARFRLGGGSAPREWKRIMLRAFEPWHLVIIGGIATLLFGAKRLPDSARSVGQSLRIFRSEVAAAKDGASGEAAVSSAAVTAPAPVTATVTTPAPAQSPMRAPEQIAPIASAAVAAEPVVAPAPVEEPVVVPRRSGV
jgi:sec-independent protein translocase protein TatA